MSPTPDRSRWLDAGLLAVIAASAWTAPLFTVRDITVQMDRLLGAAAVLAVAWLAVRRRVCWSPIHTALGVFAAIQVLTSLQAARTWPEGPKFSCIYVLGFACFALTAEWAAGRGWAAARWWIALGAVEGVAGTGLAWVANVLQVHLPGTGPAAGLGQRAVFAAKGTFAEWNLYSSFLLVGLALALWRLRPGSPGLPRAWSTPAWSAAIVVGLVSGLTRAAWLAAGALGLYWLWAARPARRHVAALVGCAAVAAAVQAVTIGASPFMFRVVEPIRAGFDRNMAGRLAITEATIRSWRLRPLLGQGAGSTNGLTVISASGAVFKKPWNGNITLFVLHDSGLVGLAALAALLAVTAAAGGRAVRRDRRAGEGSPTGPLLAAGLALLFAYQFTHGLWLMYPYVYLGLLAASTRPRVPASAGRAMPWSRERVPRPFPVERPGRR